MTDDDAWKDAGYCPPLPVSIADEEAARLRAGQPVYGFGLASVKTEGEWIDWTREGPPQSIREWSGRWPITAEEKAKWEALRAKWEIEWDRVMAARAAEEAAKGD